MAELEKLNETAAVEAEAPVTATEETVPASEDTVPAAAEPAPADRRITLHEEPVCLIALIIMALSVAMTAAADFGISMVAAPAYIVSLKFDFLTFGRAEYIVQAVMFILFCLIVRRFRPVYLTCFAVCLLYGGILDLIRLIPCLSAETIELGTNPLWLRHVLFVVGIVLTAFAVALYFQIYIYPQIYDFFVKGVCARYSLNRRIFKPIYDVVLLALSIGLSFLFFGKLKGIGIGTFVITALNGVMIGFFDRLLQKRFRFVPLWPKLKERFPEA